MSKMEEDENNNEQENEEQNKDIFERLKIIHNDILESYQSDIDKIESFKDLIQILEELIKIEKVENFFDGNTKIIDYFFQKFIPETLNNILRQNYIPGENGDDIGLNILTLYIKLLITILKQDEAKFLCKIIDRIFYSEFNFYKGETFHYNNIPKEVKKKKLMNYETFNEILLKRKFEDVEDFLIEDNIIDINTDFNESQNQKFWVRGKIKSISEDKSYFTALIPDNNIIKIKISSLDYAKKGLITTDYEWRENLNIGDRIFYYEKNQLFPCTIIDKKEEELNGIKNIIFKIGYRIYIQENDDLLFFSNYYNQRIKTDNIGKYIGENENCDEDVYFYNPRIQKEKEFSNSYSFFIDKIIPYNKVNYVIGREMNFLYYFALLIQDFCKNEYFYQFMNGLKELSKSKNYCDLLFLYFNILKKSINYLHYDFLLELSNFFIDFCTEILYNNLKELRKDLIEFTVQILIYFAKFHPKEKEKIIFESIIKSSILLLKSDILDKKLYSLKLIIKPYYVNQKNYINKLIKAINENDLIKLIFNSHSHNQVIVQSKELITLLFYENALNKKDVLIIWEETKKRDSETRSVILNIFAGMGCNQAEREIIFDMILEENINNILPEEFDILLTNRNHNKCIDFFLNGIFNNEVNSREKLNLINTYLVKTIHESDEQYNLVKKVLEKCEYYIENEDSEEVNARKSYILIIKLFNINVHLNEEDKKKLIEVFKKSINKFIDNFKNNKCEYNIHDITQKINFAKIAYKYCKEEFGSFVQFLYDFLFESNLSKEKFYNSIYELMTNNINGNYKIMNETSDLFKQKILVNDQNLENFTQEGFLTIIYLIIKSPRENDDNIIQFVLNEENNYSYYTFESNVLEFELFNSLWKILVNVKNDIISKEIWYTLNSTYKKLNQEEKINEKLNELLKNTRIDRIIELIPEMILSNEEKGLIEGINPHISLVKNCLYKIHCYFYPNSINNSPMSFDLTIAKNDTLWEIKIKLSNKFNISTDYFNILIRINNGYEKISIYNKLISEIIPEEEANHKKIIMIRSKLINNIKEIPLLNEENEMIPELENILKKWFDEYSENGIMDVYHLCDFIKRVNFLSDNIQSNDWRINLMSEYFDEGTNNLKFEGFKKYFYDRIIDSDKIDSVRENLRNMFYRNDLIPGNVPIENKNLDKNKFLRYSLANDEDFFVRLYNFYDENNMENNIKIYNFIIQLCTNEKIRELIENCDKNYLNEILTYDKKKIIQINYNMRIIGDLIEQYNKNDSDKNKYIFLFIKNNGFDLLIKLFIHLKENHETNEIDTSTIYLLRRIFYIIGSCYLTKYELYKNNFANNIENNMDEIEIYNIIEETIEENNYIKLISEDFEEEDTSSILLLLFILIFVEDEKLMKINEILNQTNFTKNLLEYVQNFKQYQDIVIKYVQIQIQVKFSLYLQSFLNHLYNLCFSNDIKTPKLIIYDLFSYIYSHCLEKPELNDFLNNFDNNLINKIINNIQSSFKGEYIEMEREKLEGYLHSLFYIKKGGNDFNNFIKFIIINVFSNNDIKISIEDNEKLKNEEYIDEETLIPQNNYLLITSQQSKIIFSMFLTQVLKNYKIDYKLFFQNEKEENENISTNRKNNPQYFSDYPPSKINRKYNHVGLRNPHCICYMNSILQQFYMIPTFRYAILQNSDNLKENIVHGIDDNNYHQLQKLFSYLTLSQRADYSPLSFCFSFKDFEGNPTDITTQKDSNEFLSLFIEKLEEELKPTPMKYLIDSVFKGNICSQLICSVCNTIKNRIEDFNYLSLEVKNLNNVYESLSKFIKGEEIDGYECDTCKKKVLVNKKNLLSHLPNVLIIYLQRICFDYECFQNRKINSRLEFPDKLNLKNYTIESTINSGKGNEEFFVKNDEYYEYYLVGVNVHYGLSDAGHYFSFINTQRTGKLNEMILDNNNWLKFNDSVISEFNTNEIEENCFGGKMNNYYNNDDMSETMQSAYMLVYERKIKSPLKIKLDKNNLELNKEIITYTNNEENEIFKKYNIFTNKGGEIFNKFFYNSDKDEYYDYLPFYSLKKLIPKKYAIEILLDNKELENSRPNDEHYNKLIEEVCLNFLKQAKESKNIDKNTLNKFIIFTNKNVDNRSVNLIRKIRKEIVDISPIYDDDVQ